MHAFYAVPNCMHLMESLAAHWGLLYKAEQGTSRQDMFGSVVYHGITGSSPDFLGRALRY
jgi:hypothetical protein